MSDDDMSVESEVFYSKKDPDYTPGNNNDNIIISVIKGFNNNLN